MLSTPLIHWAFLVMTSLAPPEQLAAAPAYPGWAETAPERRARYESIATDVVTAAEQAPIFKGNDAVRATVAYALAAAFHESGFAADVDLGPCFRGRDGKGPRCDGGLAVSMWQLRTGGEERELFEHHRLAAALEGIRRIRRSLGACRKNPPELRLAGYASGRCTMGYKEAKEIYAIAQHILRIAQPVETTTSPDQAATPWQPIHLAMAGAQRFETYKPLLQLRP